MPEIGCPEAQIKYSAKTDSTLRVVLGMEILSLPNWAVHVNVWRDSSNNGILVKNNNGILFLPVVAKLYMKATPANAVAPQPDSSDKWQETAQQDEVKRVPDSDESPGLKVPTCHYPSRTGDLQTNICAPMNTHKAKEVGVSVMSGRRNVMSEALCDITCPCIVHMHDIFQQN